MTLSALLKLSKHILPQSVSMERIGCVYLYLKFSRCTLRETLCALGLG